VTVPMRPLPILDSRSRVFFDAAAEGKLLIQRCASCGVHQFYPRAHCTRCFAPDPDWVEASGRGALHTFSIVHRTPNEEFAEDCPYVFAIVELEEGVRMTANLVDVDLRDLRCDMPVQVVFRESPDGSITLPQFTSSPSGQ
jgi:uncharacterized OB-fold protein